MHNHTFASIRHTRFRALGAIVVLCALVAPLTAETTAMSNDLGAMLPNNSDNETVVLTETCDEMEDSAISAKAGSAWLHTVQSLLNTSGPTGRTWLSAPPVRPPIVLG